jgi:hypothetical protein
MMKNQIELETDLQMCPTVEKMLNDWQRMINSDRITRRHFADVRRLKKHSISSYVRRLNQMLTCINRLYQSVSNGKLYISKDRRKQLIQAAKINNQFLKVYEKQFQPVLEQPDKFELTFKTDDYVSSQNS